MGLQAVQNKWLRFCLKLNDTIKSADCKKKNWLPIHERVSQCSLCSINKFFTKNCPKYFDDINFPLETNGIHTRSSYQKLNVPHRKINVGQKGLAYIGPSLWNNLNKTLKNSTSINAFRDNMKQHYFNELKKKRVSISVFCTFDVSKWVHSFDFSILYVLL